MLDMTSFAAALKQVYTPERVANMTYKNNPLLAMMPKNENFKGENMVIPVIYGSPQGRSATFANALANQTDLDITKFTITRAKDHSIASIDNETLLASQGDAYAFLQAATAQIDGAYDSISRSLAIALYRSGSGSIGQCNASVTGTSLVLKNANDVTNFERNMELVFCAADGGTSVKSGSVTVTHVNRSTGTLTVDALTAIDGTAGVAANDFIFVQGDYDRKIKGVQAWIPNSDPSSASFFGVDRTKDITRLGGVRYDGSALPIEEALIGGIHAVAREGGTPSHCFMNFENWNRLVISLGSKVSYIDEVVKSGDASLSFRAISIHGPKGPVKVIADQNCPSDRAFLLQLDTWKLHSLGPAPRLSDTDGLKMLRVSDADGVQVRIAYYAQLASKAPGYNCNVKLA